MVDIRTERRVPSFSEYMEVARAIGWKEVVNQEALKTALDNSIFGVVVYVDNNLAGMGRMVGDRAIYFYIQDIAVKPVFREKGIGKLIMETIMEYFEREAPQKSVIAVYTPDSTREFYAKFGFELNSEMSGYIKVKA